MQQEIQSQKHMMCMCCHFAEAIQDIMVVSRVGVVVKLLAHVLHSDMYDMKNREMLVLNSERGFHQVPESLHAAVVTVTIYCTHSLYTHITY